MILKKFFLLPLFFLSFACSGQEKGKAIVNENIPVDVFQKKMKEMPDEQLLDVRTPSEYEEGHLEGALNMDWRSADFAEKAAQLDRNRPVLVYCLGGGRSSAAAKKLQEMGFTTIYNMEGGFMKWTAANKPVKYPASALDKPQQGMTVADYKKLVSTEKEKYVLVDFNAKWCGPCIKMLPMLEKVAAEKKDKVIFLKVDADENKALLKEKGIDAIPYFEMYRDGKLIWKRNGYMNEETFLAETGL